MPRNFAFSACKRASKASALQQAASPLENAQHFLEKNVVPPAPPYRRRGGGIDFIPTPAGEPEERDRKGASAVVVEGARDGAALSVAEQLGYGDQLIALGDEFRDDPVHGGGGGLI